MSDIKDDLTMVRQRTCAQSESGHHWVERDGGGQVCSRCSMRILPGAESAPMTGGRALAEAVNHPSHYGGDTTYETIKVIHAWDLGFDLGNAVKYISRAGKKDPAAEIEDLKKAVFYLNHHIADLERARA